MPRQAALNVGKPRRRAVLVLFLDGFSVRSVAKILKLSDDEVLECIRRPLYRFGNDLRSSR